MRLIDADAWLKEHCEGCKYKRSGMCSEEDPVCGSVELMYEAPTIDAVKVVFCCECKQNEKNGGDCNRRLPITRRDYVCEINTTEYIKLNYCSYGERK